MDKTISFIRRFIKWESIPYLLIICLSLCYAIVSFTFPLIGDDLAHASFYHTITKPYPFLRTLFSMWFNVNGRMGDALSSVWMPLVPQPFTAALVGLSIATLSYLIIKLGNVHRGDYTMQTIVMAVIVFTLPWWDSMLLFACQFNYILASALSLVACAIMLNERLSEKSLYLLTPIVFLAGGMHEASGLPLSAALVFYFYMNRKTIILSKARRIMLIALCLGACFTLSSPASWERLLMSKTPDDPMWLLAIKNSYYGILMVIIVALHCAKHPQRFKQMLSSIICVFIVAALGSTFFSVVGGIVGRPGWFSQVLSIIVILMLINQSRPMRRMKAITAVLAMAIIGHLALFTETQLKISKEIDALYAGYNNSTDGIIYLDTPHSDNTSILALGKNFIVFPPNDTYSFSVMHQYLAHYTKPFPILLPAEAKEKLSHNISGDIAIGDFIISRNEPEGDNVYHFKPYERVPDYRIIELPHSNKLLIAQPFECHGQKLWCIRPTVYVWGGRIPYKK